MLDGIELKGRTNVVALGITTDGVKIPLGLWEGSTENATVATALLSDLVERGLDAEQGVLCVIDGAKALRKAVRDVFGDARRCSAASATRSETCSSTCPSATARPSSAGCAAPGPTDHDRALDAAHALAAELDRSHPGAAASLREGLEETLTLTRLGITGALKRTLESTNPCESMIEACGAPAATSSAGSPATWRCAGRPPGCSKPSASSAGSSATATSPSSPSPSNATSTAAAAVPTPTEEAVTLATA